MTGQIGATYRIGAVWLGFGGNWLSRLRTGEILCRDTPAFLFPVRAITSIAASPAASSFSTTMTRPLSSSRSFVASVTLTAGRFSRGGLQRERDDLELRRRLDTLDHAISTHESDNAPMRYVAPLRGTFGSRLDWKNRSWQLS